MDSQISGSMVQDCYLGGGFGTRRADGYGMAEHRRALPSESGRKSRPAHDNRRYLNGMLHVLRVGCPCATCMSATEIGIPSICASAAGRNKGCRMHCLKRWSTWGWPMTGSTWSTAPQFAATLRLRAKGGLIRRLMVDHVAAFRRNPRPRRRSGSHSRLHPDRRRGFRLQCCF